MLDVRAATWTLCRSTPTATGCALGLTGPPWTWISPRSASTGSTSMRISPNWTRATSLNSCAENVPRISRMRSSRFTPPPPRAARIPPSRLVAWKVMSGSVTLTRTLPSRTSGRSTAIGDTDAVGAPVTSTSTRAGSTLTRGAPDRSTSACALNLPIWPPSSAGPAGPREPRRRTERHRFVPGARVVSNSPDPVRRGDRGRNPPARPGGTGMPEYMLLIVNPTEDGPSPEELGAEHPRWMQYTQDLIDAGVMRGGNGLEGGETATTVRVRDGETLVTDGPFAETKEGLVGYYVIDVPDLDAALKWAARIP